MSQKICLGPRRSSVWGHQLSAGDIPTQDEGACAMTEIFKFASLHFSRSQRQSRMFALQGLDACQFISTYRPFALLSPLGGLVIELTDGYDGFFAMRISRWREPIADQMRLEIPLFNTRAAWRGEMVGRMPRRITSSAISRPVHWLIGRSLGCSQARATIWHVCSALISEGRPGRGTSVRRSWTERSERGTACKPIQRMRQLRTVSTLAPSSLAISAFLFPSAEAWDHASSFGQLLRGTMSPHKLLEVFAFLLV